MSDRKSYPEPLASTEEIPSPDRMRPAADTEYDIDVTELWRLIWRGKWFLIIVSAIAAFSSLGFALVTTELYRSEILLAPTDDSSSISGLTNRLGALGSFAGLAGVDLEGAQTSEAIATLESRDFLAEFIQDKQLLPTLFADDWNSESSRWVSNDPDGQPDVRDGVKYLVEEVLYIRHSAETGLVTLSVRWRDPRQAALWATDLVDRLNQRMRKRALIAAEKNIDYLQSQITDTEFTMLRQSLGSVLEREMEKLMLARGNTEYAFRVIDSASVPKDPEYPNKVLFLIFGGLFGAILAVAILLIRYRFATRRI